MYAKIKPHALNFKHEDRQYKVQTYMDDGDEGTRGGATPLLVVSSLLLEDETLPKTCVLSFWWPIPEREIKYKEKPNPPKIFKNHQKYNLKYKRTQETEYMVNQLTAKQGIAQRNVNTKLQNINIIRFKNTRCI